MDWEPHDRHWIRLRGPWEASWIDADGTFQPAQRVTLPIDWKTLFDDRSGTARFARSFQQPTRLDPDERVCLTLTNVGADVRCRLNDAEVPRLPSPLGDAACWPADDCCSFDLTAHLQQANRLSLDVTVRNPGANPVGLHEPVLLEIVTLDEDAN